MKDSDVLLLDEPKISTADQFYLPQVLIGLGTTMKHMLHVLSGTDRVIQYPEERREDIKVEDGGMLLRTYRGVHRLNKDEEGRVKCVACFMCSTACPARCIHIEEDPWEIGKVFPVDLGIIALSNELDPTTPGRMSALVDSIAVALDSRAASGP